MLNYSTYHYYLKEAYRSHGVPDGVFAGWPHDSDASELGKGGVTVVIVDNGERILGLGIALCSMSDKFLPSYGKQLAAQRANESMAFLLTTPRLVPRLRGFDYTSRRYDLKTVSRIMNLVHQAIRSASIRIEKRKEQQ